MKNNNETQRHPALEQNHNSTGNMRWYKTYNSGSNRNDEAQDIEVTENNLIYVSGRSLGSDTVYLTVAYEQGNLSSEIKTDTANNPLWMKGQIILKVDSSAVKRNIVDNEDINFGGPRTFLKDWAVDSLKKSFPFDEKDCMLARIFYKLKTTDTISISRLGERIPIPDFWSAFVLVYPKASATEIKLCDTLNKLFPFVEYADLDVLATLTSATSDPKYNFFQYNLHGGGPYNHVDINVEDAWNYTAGRKDIKVGIFDTGLLTSHRDFYGGVDSFFNLVNPIVKGGWDFVLDDTIGVFGIPDYGGHGTQMAGIIAAGRNNGEGIAGIAGGDSIFSPGVSLFGLRIFSYITIPNTPSPVASLHNFLNGLIQSSSLTPDSVYGYGINVLNQSFIFTGYEQDTSGYFIDSNWSSIIEAYHYANRNKVVMPSGTGNKGDIEDPQNPYIYYPAAFDDDWVIATGGTGGNGGWCGSALTDEFISNYGLGIDVGAPASIAFVYTDIVGSNPYNGSSGSYGASNGTSSATAHVSGVAALLLSYLNDTVPNYKNLAPEDVEFIIQRSAFNVDTPGYDILSGFGRLNAGGALTIADTSKRKLHHFDSDSVSHYNAFSTIQTAVPLKLLERAIGLNGQKFDRKNYIADVYKVTSTFTLSLTDSIVAYWARPSSSILYMYDGTGSLLPHEKVKFESISQTQAVVSGYFFHLYDSATHVSKGWLPADTTDIPHINFAISVLTGDSIIAPWDSLLNLSEIAQTEHSSIRIFPNPATDYLVVDVSSDCGTSSDIAVYDLNGKNCGIIFSGKLAENSNRFFFNTSKLLSGVYCVGIRSNCESKFLKFLKR